MTWFVCIWGGERQAGWLLRSQLQGWEDAAAGEGASASGRSVCVVVDWLTNKVICGKGHGELWIATEMRDPLHNSRQEIERTRGLSLSWRRMMWWRQPRLGGETAKTWNKLWTRTSGTWSGLGYATQKTSQNLCASVYNGDDKNFLALAGLGAVRMVCVPWAQLQEPAPQQ